MRFALFVTVFLAIFVGCDKADPRSTGPVDEPNEAAVVIDLVAEAKRWLASGDLNRANELLSEHLENEPGDRRVLELAGDLAARLGNSRLAIDRYEALLAEDAEASIAVRDKLAQAWMRVGQPFESVAVLEETIRQFPNVAALRFDLAGLAAMLGLESPVVDSLTWLAQHNQGHQEGLVLLAHPARLEPDAEVCRSALAKCPSDRRAEYGIARLEAFQERWEQVAERLEPVVELHGDCVPAIALYGRALVELKDTARISVWSKSLPKEVEASAQYWDAAGRWARRQGDHHAAAKAFLEAVRLDRANNGQTLVDLSTSLKRIGREQEAKRVADRAEKIAALRDATNTFFERGSRSQSAAMRVANHMAELGRLWEAEGWARWAIQFKEETLPDARQQYSAIRSRLSPQTPWQSPESLIADTIDSTDLPDVVWSADVIEAEEASSTTVAGSVKFIEKARQLGLEHTCELASGTEDDGMWIYQSVGGGAAVLDFDLNGWPDLTFAMLDGQPLKNNSKPNRFFRNREGRFQDVTSIAGLFDDGFGQGITAGDFNADGFPDLFDGNIGRNRLYLNNGDGTFTDATERVGLGSRQSSRADWTTSVAIADFNGDGHADLYEVNYCDGSEPFEKECRVKQTGKLASCTPLDFKAQSDRVWFGQGDGTVKDVTDSWLQEQNIGRGLGMIVGDLDQRPGIDLYIANDMTRNQLWSRSADPETSGYADLATIQGLAVNHRSLSQASMGIAAGDPDSDGDLDFFVTHFSDDHNTYYEQVSAGVWQDRSYAVGLGRTSEPLLGFGTEWVDFDNNGALELIIANGHVSDLTHTNRAFKMPTQVFRRGQNGVWAEIDSSLLGEYFVQPHLGRALVTLDADRDGRVDTSLTQIHEPVALLINDSETDCQAVGLVLVATNSHRDAVGATVTATIGDSVYYAQLVAGDGFMCSNQRRLSIGLGNAAKAENLVVKWPSGESQAFGSVAAGQDYMLVEGADDAYPLFHHE